MKKLIKKFSILIVAALCIMCMAAFAACGDGEKLDPNTVYITVVDENGNPIDGTTFGKGDWDPDNHQVQIQFCTLDGGCTPENANVGKDGKAEFDLSLIKALAESSNADTVELHVLGVTAIGYEKNYSQYKISSIPQTIKVTLKKA